MNITVLAGGVGAARFLEGLVQVVPQESITVVSNTGDDEEFFGLHVSPDIDIVIYTLAGAVDAAKGWGLQDESFAALDCLKRFGYETWFNLGDRDLATHTHRTDLLRSGATLSEATRSVAAAFGLRLALLPMTDDRVRTIVETPAGTLPFQRYFVQRQTQDDVHAVRFDGADHARPAPGVLAALRDADIVIVAPSNPLVSIAPILAVPGTVDALRERTRPVVAISPIVGGRALKGPADRMMTSLGHDSSAAGIARIYAAFVDTLVVDEEDASMTEAVQKAGVRAAVAQTVMRGPDDKRALAEAVLQAAT